MPQFPVVDGVAVTSEQWAAILNSALNAYSQSQNVLINTGSPIYMLISYTPGKPVKLNFYSDPSFTQWLGSVEDDPAIPPSKAAYDLFVENGLSSGGVIQETVGD